MNYYPDPTGAYIANILIPLVFIIFLFIFLFSIFGTSKSRRYRRELVNLYVAAKIRAIAAKEDIDISKEYESFKKWLKKQRLEDKDLDSSIEEELKDKIIEDTKEKGK